MKMSKKQGYECECGHKLVGWTSEFFHSVLQLLKISATGGNLLTGYMYTRCFKKLHPNPAV